MLAIFREGRCHLALVTEDPISAMRCMAEGKRPSSENCNVIGIVTLEDVIEEILQGRKKKIRIHIKYSFLIIHFVSSSSDVLIKIIKLILLLVS